MENKPENNTTANNIPSVKTLTKTITVYNDNGTVCYTKHVNVRRYTDPQGWWSDDEISDEE